MSDTDISAYARHSRWTEPDALAAQLALLPADPARLPEVVDGLVLHPLLMPDPARGSTEPQLRTIPEMVGSLLDKDGGALDRPRPPETRVLGTCRNYALLACAVLRQRAIPARLRVGFADYFTPGFWEDHWVCEYQDGVCWRLLDPELSGAVRQRFGISFDPSNVPRTRFLAAGPAWQKLRRDKCDPARFGVSAIGISGLWFVASSLLRDLAALNKEEMMPWDYWGPARDFAPGSEIALDWLLNLDRLAEDLRRIDDGDRNPRRVLNEHRWAKLTGSVLSYPQGNPVEVSITE